MRVSLKKDMLGSCEPFQNVLQENDTSFKLPPQHWRPAQDFPTFIALILP